MSLILEALKKAEQSRQDHAQPVIAVPAAMPADRGPLQYLPWLAGAVGILVGAAALAVILRSGPEVGAVASIDPARDLIQDTPAPVIEKRDDVRVLSTEVRSGQPKPAAQSKPTPRVARPAPADAPKPGTVQVRDLLAEESGAPRSTGVTPGTVTVQTQAPAPVPGSAPAAAAGTPAAQTPAPTRVATAAPAAAVKPGTVQVADLMPDEPAQATGQTANAPALTVPPQGSNKPVHDLRSPQAKRSAPAPNTTVAAATPPPSTPAPQVSAQTRPRQPPNNPLRKSPQEIQAEQQASSLPTMAQLVAEGLLQPPDVRLDMLVYRDNPASRIAFINMRRYRIGEQTAEGATVEDITQAGVHLFYNGRRFLLQPR